MRRIFSRDIPPRKVDPGHRTRDYVDRASGGVDEARLRRLQRSDAASPVANLGAAIQRFGAAISASATGFDFGRFYREPNVVGVSSERIRVALLNDAGTPGMATVMIGRCHEGTSANWNPGSIAAGDDDGISVAVSSEVANDGTWTCTGSFTGIVGVGNNQWIPAAFPIASGSVMFRILNTSGNSQDPANGTVRVRCCNGI